MPHVKLVFANLFRFLKQCSGAIAFFTTGLLLRYFLPLPAKSFADLLVFPLGILVWPKSSFDDNKGWYRFLKIALTFVIIYAAFALWLLLNHRFPALDSVMLTIAYLLYIVIIAFHDWFRKQFD